MPLCFTEIIHVCLKRWVTIFNKYWNTACLENAHSNLLKEIALSSKRKTSMPAMLHFLQMMHVPLLAMHVCKRCRGCGVTSFKECCLESHAIFTQSAVYLFMHSLSKCEWFSFRKGIPRCAKCVEGTRWNKTFLKTCRSFSQRSWCPEGNLHALCAWSAARAQRKTQFCFIDTPMSYSTVAFDNRPKGVFKLCHFVCGVLLSNCLTLPTALLSALCVALLLRFSDTFY